MNDPDPPIDSLTPREKARLAVMRLQQERHDKAIQEAWNHLKRQNHPNREPEKE